MSLLDRLELCTSELDRFHTTQNRRQIRDYSTRIFALLEAASPLIAQLATTSSGGASSPSPERAALLCWARRTLDSIDEPTLYKCSPRLEQSLEDLVYLLGELFG